MIKQATWSNNILVFMYKNDVPGFRLTLNLHANLNFIDICISINISLNIDQLEQYKINYKIVHSI